MASEPSELKILYWNANSIQQNLHDFYNYLETNEIDIALLCETFLKPDMNINAHPDYVWYRMDRLNGEKGGVAIVVNRKIPHEPLPAANLHIIEVVGVKIFTLTSHISFFSAYLPGATSYQDIGNYFATDIRKICSTQGSFFVCGDLNSRHRLWNCLSSNRAGRVLYNELNYTNFLIHHPPTHTYCPMSDRKTHSTIDLILTNGHHDISQPLTIDEFTSDHLPVVFSVYSGTFNTNPQTTIPSYKNANWPSFMSYINQKINLQGVSLSTINGPFEIDRMVDNLTTAILEAKTIAIPNIVPYRYKLKLTNEVIELKTFRNLCRRRWSRNKNRNLKKFVNKLSNEIRLRIFALRTRNWDKLLQSCHGRPTKLWKVTKLLKNRNRVFPPLKSNGSVHVTNSEKSELVAQTFSNVFQHHNLNNNSELDTAIGESITSIENSTPELTADMLVTPSEIRNIIRTLRPTNSAGPDQINNKLLKKLPRKAIVYATHIFNGCLKYSYFPTCWKIANVIPILKPGKDPTDPKSYRPISLLDTLGKILERLILRRLKTFINDLRVLPDTQFGFREKHSTCHQLFRVTRHIKTGLSNRLSTGMVLLDVEKAFDCVWHAALLHKLLLLGFPLILLKIIASFLTQRKFYVTIGGIKSTDYCIPSGVPQGAVLSPSLFNIFTHDFPSFTNVHSALFADDSAIFCTHSRASEITDNLQLALDTILNYYEKWKIRINPTKTQAVFFTKRRTRELPTSQLVLDGHQIKWDNNAKYLGLFLDKKLKFSTHFDYVSERVHKLIKILYPLINRKSLLSLDQKTLLYKSVFQPTILYSCMVWRDCAESHKKRLQTLQNKCLKMILNASRYERTVDVHERTQCQLITDKIDKYYEKFVQRLPFVDNPLVDQILQEL
jgi:Reverse transcriptase (RNA-dependent DNA polymerase)/Endonuclease-reverse transcriptase